MAEWLTLELEVRGLSLACSVVSLNKELNSTCLSSPRCTCINGWRRHTAGGPREGAWLLRISSDRDDQMNVGKNQTLQKIPGPKKKNLIKITCQIS